MTQSGAQRTNPHDGVFAGRVFICGDIHGCFDQLEAGLQAVGFDKNADMIIALGDLVDRGPRSQDVVRLLREKWFTSIKGNHEDLMWAAFHGDTRNYVKNGGQWFLDLSRDEQAEMVALTQDLPVALTIETRSGRKIGLVHVDLPGYDWDRFIERLQDPRVEQYALGCRWRFEMISNGAPAVPIENVDHVYFGHSPTRRPMRAANMSWIDTGCFHTGVLTIEELL